MTEMMSPIGQTASTTEAAAQKPAQTTPNASESQEDIGIKHFVVNTGIPNAQNAQTAQPKQTAQELIDEKKKQLEELKKKQQELEGELETATNLAKGETIYSAFQQFGTTLSAIQWVAFFGLAKLILAGSETNSDK